MNENEKKFDLEERLIDFTIMIFTICLKELRETLVCLKLIKRKPLLKDLSFVEIAIKENNELISIFVTSVNTASKSKVTS